MWCDRQRSWTGIALTLAVAGWGPPPRHDPAGQPVGVPAATLGDGTLSFDGHATTGDFVGTTSAVTGAVLASPDYASVRGWVEARVATLRTGNGLRDRDLRKVMEVDTYPTMRYDVGGATVRSATRPDSVSLVLHGTLRLHGVARAVDVPVTVARGDGSARVVGTFPLNVTDYQVRGLSKMMGMLRMHEGIEVHLALRFVIAE
jgi:polyisoprenoid-binding protein YceI